MLAVFGQATIEAAAESLDHGVRAYGRPRDPNRTRCDAQGLRRE
jgi:hypothetical protein